MSRAIDPDEPEPRDEIPPGPAIAEDLSGELTLVLVTSDTGETAEEHTLELYGEEISTYRYWGHTLEPNERVYHVRPAEIDSSGEYLPVGPTLSWPVSKLTPVARGDSE